MIRKSRNDGRFPGNHVRYTLSIATHRLIRLNLNSAKIEASGFRCNDLKQLLFLGMKKKGKVKKEPAKKAKPMSNTEKSPGQNDFGGLPQRDLKKNLGCG